MLFSSRPQTGLRIPLALSLALVLLALATTAWAITWQTKSSLLTQRTRLGVAVADNLIYAIGGYYGSAGGTLAIAEVFTPNANSWATIADMPIARRNHAAVGYNGKVYVFGGQYRDWFSTHPEYMSACAPVHIFDPNTDSWSTGASIPTPRIELAAAELNGEIWVIGGAYDPDTSNSLTTCTGAVEIYNPAKNTWRAGPSLPNAHRKLAAASLDGKIYVSGGWTESSSDYPYWDECAFMYVSSGGGWTQLGDMPYRVQGHAMAGYQGRLYILGGHHIASSDPSNTTWSTTNKVTEYDPGTGTYSSANTFSQIRCFHGAAQAGGTVYVVGGSKDYLTDTAAGSILSSTQGGVVDSCTTLADLDVSVDGDGAIYSTPGISCGSDCTEKYCVGTPVTLTAVAADGAAFTEWTGDCSGTNPTCEVDVNVDLNVVAHFAAAKPKANVPANSMLLLNTTN